MHVNIAVMSWYIIAMYRNVAALYRRIRPLYRRLPVVSELPG
jgi:hypothetical protein